MKRLLTLFALLALPFGLWFFVQADLSFAEGEEEAATAADEEEEILSDEEVAELQEELDGLIDEMEGLEEELLQMEDSLVCAATVQHQANILMGEQQAFYSEYFLTEGDASELIENAQKFQRFVEKELERTYRKYTEPGFFSKVRKKEFTLTQQANANRKCNEVLQANLEISRFMYQKFAMDIAADKRATKAIDGMKAMNANLSEFYLNFNSTFPGVFTEFNNALPCYAKSCVSR